VREISQPLTCRQFRGRVQRRYQSPEFTKAVCCPEDLWSLSGMRMLLDSRNRVGFVRLATRMGHKNVVVKEFRVRGIERLKSRLHISKARKAWRGSCLLQERKIPTPAPIAFLEPAKSHSGGNGFFFCEWEPEAVEIRTLFPALSGKAMELLLKDLAVFLHICHDRSILHCDLSDGNILVFEKGNRGYGFSLLDTNRIKNRKRIRSWLRAKNLIRLGIPLDYQRFFIQSYLGGMSRMFWLCYRLNKKIFSGYIRMKKKLKLKRLARAFRIQ
jgi:hypothetical protein